jgi:hypothetical protein
MRELAPDEEMTELEIDAEVIEIEETVAIALAEHKDTSSVYLDKEEEEDTRNYRLAGTRWSRIREKDSDDMEAPDCNRTPASLAFVYGVTLNDVYDLLEQDMPYIRKDPPYTPRDYFEKVRAGLILPTRDDWREGGRGVGSRTIHKGDNWYLTTDSAVGRHKVA